MAKESRSTSGMGGHKSDSKKSEKKKDSKKPHSVHVRKAASGGFIATHHFKGDDGMSQEPEDHVLQDMPALQEHMNEHMGDEEGAEQGQAQPAPQMGGA